MKLTTGWYLGYWAGTDLKACMFYSEETKSFHEHTFESGVPASETGYAFDPILKMQVVIQK